LWKILRASQWAYRWAAWLDGYQLRHCGCG
jgi:hypothetical protein